MIPSSEESPIAVPRNLGYSAPQMFWNSKKTRALEAEVEKLKAEVERLSADNDGLCGILIRYQTAYVHLDEDHKNLRGSLESIRADITFILSYGDASVFDDIFDGDDDTAA